MTLRHNLIIGRAIWIFIEKQKSIEHTVANRAGIHMYIHCVPFGSVSHIYEMNENKKAVA